MIRHINYSQRDQTMVEDISTRLQKDPTKRCPYCFTPLKLNAEHCIECKKKVGAVNKLGMAQKPPHYKAYAAAILWITVLGIYIWKIFFQRWFS